MKKVQLRHDYLARRGMLTVEEHERYSAEIASSLFRHLDLSQVRVLHCFIAIDRFREVDTRPIFQRIWSHYPQVQTVVPRVDHEAGELQSLKYCPDTELEVSRWQISEPSHNDRVEPVEVDIVLVPLVCFDRNGHRVGYGKGFYDRFLSRCRVDCQKIGLSLFPAIDEISDADPNDVRLDRCITPDEIVSFN